MGWVGLGWAGLGWVGLGWVGLGWVGLGCVRICFVYLKRPIFNFFLLFLFWLDVKTTGGSEA